MNLAYHPDRFDHARLAEDVLRAHPVLYEKIGAACDIEESQVARSLTEVIRFLNLIAMSDTMLTPSVLIDLAWHEFILCTRAYGNFCERHFGRMIHHHPGGLAEKNREQFRRTLELYREHFGTPEPGIWGGAKVPAASECGNCGPE
jgi:hypothetical protein